MISRYRSRVSGPLLDRIDIQVEVPAVAYSDLASDGREEESSRILERVLRARQVQIDRASSAGTTPLNARLPSSTLRKLCPVDAAGQRLLGRSVERLGLSARAHDRILKVARTLADMEGNEKITTAHLGEAIQYRCLDRPVSP